MKINTRAVLAICLVLLVVSSPLADGFIFRLIFRGVKAVVRTVAKIVTRTVTRIPKPRVSVRVPVRVGTINKVLTVADLSLQLGNVISGGCMYEPDICKLQPEIEALQKEVEAKSAELDRLDKTNNLLYPDIEAILQKNQDIAQEADYLSYLSTTIFEKIGQPQQLDELGADYASNAQQRVDIFKTIIEQYEDAIGTRLVITGVTAFVPKLLYRGGKRAYDYLKSTSKIKAPTDFKNTLSLVPKKTGIRLLRPKGIDIGKNLLNKVKSFVSSPRMVKIRSMVGKGSMVVTSIAGLGLTLAIDISMAKKMKSSLTQTRNELLNMRNELNNNINEEAIANAQLNAAFETEKDELKKMGEIVQQSYFVPIVLDEIPELNTKQVILLQETIINGFKTAAADLEELNLNVDTMKEIKAGAAFGDPVARIIYTIKSKQLPEVTEKQVLMAIAREFPDKTSYDGKDLKSFRGKGQTYLGCYNDGMPRDMERDQWKSGKNTVELCVDRCRLSGYRYAGLQYGRDCWCDNQYGRYGESIDVNLCNNRCTGNAGETCGGVWTNSVYEVNEPEPAYRWRASRTDGLLTWVSTGSSGTWGVNSNNNIYYRTGSYGGNRGSSWRSVDGGLQQITVGQDIVWGVSSSNKIYYRRSISKSNPTGSGWVSVGGLMKRVSVHPLSNELWGVNSEGNIFKRVGVASTNPVGTSWQYIQGINAKDVSCDRAGVWAISTDDKVYYRKGTYASDANSRLYGSGWQLINGQLKQITSGGDLVLGVSKWNHVFARAGITETAPSGTHWISLKPLVGLNQISASGMNNDLWTTNTKGEIDYFKTN